MRPDAVTSPERLFCHCDGRGNSSAQMIPGWPCSFVAALEPGRSSWTRLLDAIRLGPADDLAAVTAAQVRDVVQQLIAGGHWRDGRPAILGILDARDEPAPLGLPPAGPPVPGVRPPGPHPGPPPPPPPRPPRPH